jgi:hypothetical protein
MGAPDTPQEVSKAVSRTDDRSFEMAPFFDGARFMGGSNRVTEAVPVLGLQPSVMKNALLRTCPARIVDSVVDSPARFLTY